MDVMSMIRFWKKDTINKLIVITSTLLIVTVAALGYLMFNMPEGKSVQGALAEYLPLQIVSQFAFLKTPTAVIADTPLPTASAVPTLTLVPPTFVVIESSPAVVSTVDEDPVITMTFTPTAVVQLTLSKDCIPDSPRQLGKVLEVLDGNTSKMLIDGLVYVVRYIGVGVPGDLLGANAATGANVDLVYAKDVTLVADQVDKDPSGRLLRYVLVEDTFVNLELIQKGLTPAAKGEVEAACNEAFGEAGQAAMSARVGIWAVSPTPRP
jgi:hypothetical protein